jgi:signal transduction histidine kinase
MGRADPEARAELAPVLARVADSLRGADFAVSIDLPARLPALAIDPAALETVLVTLGENARQAGASSLTITARRDDGMIRLRLADNGPGIPAGDREKVFDPFFTSKRETGGTGLGLPIAQALLQGSQGWLELETVPSGASFVLAVPEAP